MKKLLLTLNNLFPQKQVGLYLIIGIWNTFFGYGIYAFFVWILNEKFPFSYMLAAVLSNIISVTQSFLSYKYIVFKTKGNIWKEYLKCWGVYGSASLINLAFLPILVTVCAIFLPVNYKQMAPYIGGFLLLASTIAISFLGHKNITFKPDLILE